MRERKIQKICIKLIKYDNADINLQKFKCCPFELSIYQSILEKVWLSQNICIDDNRDNRK